MSNKINGYEEEAFIQISALQHYIFCPRQCALIHIEQLWEDNLLTAEGRLLHEKVDTADYEQRGDVRLDFGVPLRSLRLGLVGKADLVEFYKLENGIWQPFPVEYKRGKPKVEHCDKVQLCAQGLCLEEMLKVEVTEGAIFYGRPRRRLNVFFDEKLRHETEMTSAQVHVFISKGITPKAEYAKKCESCSLIDLCMPKTCEGQNSVTKYLRSVLETV